MLEVLTDLSAVQVIVGIGLGASVFCYLLGMYSAEQFFSEAAAPSPEGTTGDKSEGITILKPLKGLEMGLYDNLASLCRQDYQRFQIVCGVAADNDPAATVVRKLQRDFPDIDIDLVVDNRVYGANYKVSNLINMYRVAKYDIIAIADSDIRVKPGYLASLHRGLQQPNAGIVTCPYRAVNRGGMPTLVESMFINTDFTPLVMLARKVERSTYAFGATIAMRRKVLEEIGGFGPLVNTLADDYELGYRVAQKGYDLILCHELVDTVLALGTWQRLIDHQLRWARTYRICRPGGYFGSVLTHGTLWAGLNVLVHGFSPIASLFSAGALAVRYASAMSISWRHLKTDTNWVAMALVPVKDLFFDGIWLLAFAGDTVIWGGHRFRVARNGEMVDLDGTRTFADLAPAVEELTDEPAALPRTAESN